MRWLGGCLRNFLVGLVFIALASCATRPRQEVRIEQTAASSKEIKRPIVAGGSSPRKKTPPPVGAEKSSHRAGQTEDERGQSNQAFALVKNLDEVTEVEEKMPGVGQNQKCEGVSEEGAADSGDSVEEGDPMNARGVSAGEWQTDELVSKGWKFEQSDGVLSLVKRDEPQGETPGLFEDAIIQNRVRSVLIAAGHPEAAESVKVSGGVVVMVLDPKDGGESLLTAIEAVFSVVGVQRLEVSPRL